jgi:hypothetical protein
MGQLVETHFNTIPNTHNIEASAITLIREEFPDEQIKTFIKVVCRWGNYEGLSGCIIRLYILSSLNLFNLNTFKY